MIRKSLIALAAATVAGAAYAQSSLTISGRVDINYGWVDGSGGTTDAARAFANSLDQQRVDQNGTVSTRILFEGSEDLGGGLHGVFRIDIRPDLVEGGDLRAGSQYVGITGDFGEVRLGRLDSAFSDNWEIANPFDRRVGSGFDEPGVVSRYLDLDGVTAPTRFNGAIGYLSPVFNGVQGSILFVPEDTDADATRRPGVIDVGLSFTQGPINAKLSWQQTRASRTVDAEDSPIGVGGRDVQNALWLLGVSYAIGGLTLHGGHFREQVDVADVESADITGWTGGVSYTTGPWTVKAAFTQSEDNALPANQVFTNLNGAAAFDPDLLETGADRNVLGLGVEYSFSQRTALYGRFENQDFGPTGIQTVIVGIRHTF